PRPLPPGPRAALGDPETADSACRSKPQPPAPLPIGSIATRPGELTRRPLAWPMSGSRSLAARAVRQDFFLQPTAAPVARRGRPRSDMVCSLATLLSMLGNIAQRLPCLWARVANLNELPGNFIDNYHNIQADILETFVDRGQLRALAQPTMLPNGRRIPGLKLDPPRQLALMHALVRFCHVAAQNTFSTAEIYADVLAALEIPAK